MIDYVEIEKILTDIKYASDRGNDHFWTNGHHDLWSITRRLKDLVIAEIQALEKSKTSADLMQKATLQLVTNVLDAIKTHIQELDDQFDQALKDDKNYAARLLGANKMEQPFYSIGISSLFNALKQTTCVLRIPGSPGVDTKWTNNDYNWNLQNMRKDAKTYMGHGSPEWQLLGAALLFLGVAALITFVLLFTVPALNPVLIGFISAMDVTGINALVSLSVLAAVSGGSSFFNNRQQGVSKAAAKLAQQPLEIAITPLNA